MTAAALASQAGLSRAYLSLIESGDRIPPQSTIERIATGLRVDVGLLQALLDDKPAQSKSTRVRELAASLRRLAEAESELKQKLG
jgi:transcriptional regulator with XRE-family HTH domain